MHIRHTGCMTYGCHVMHLFLPPNYDLCLDIHMKLVFETSMDLKDTWCISLRPNVGMYLGNKGRLIHHVAKNTISHYCLYHLLSPPLILLAEKNEITAGWSVKVLELRNKKQEKNISMTTKKTKKLLIKLGIVPWVGTVVSSIQNWLFGLNSIPLPCPSPQSFSLHLHFTSPAQRLLMQDSWVIN